MAYKRLEQHVFKWPAIRDGVLSLNPAQFDPSFRYFLIVLRDMPVSRLTERILRPSRKTHRLIFAVLSINITCSFLHAHTHGC